MTELSKIGFHDFFQQQLLDGVTSLTPARVQSVLRGRYVLLTASEENRAAVLSGRLEYVFQSQIDFPAVGDFVLVRPGAEDDLLVIEQVLERQSKITRKQVGRSSEGQMIAANVDYAWIVQSCNQDFNLRRLERYLVALSESGTIPIVVLTKADLRDEQELADLTTQVRGITEGESGVKVHAVSSVTSAGLPELTFYLSAGKTVALIGSSGVGKTTLINAICPDLNQAVQDVRGGDDKGRHTTTHRELFFTPHGGMIIDTPGMREFGLTAGDIEGSGLFQDIDALAQDCQFRNCSHDNEPGCAVQLAITEGRLESGRLQSLKKLSREQAYQQSRQDSKVKADTKKRWKSITKMMRNRPNLKT